MYFPFVAIFNYSGYVVDFLLTMSLKQEEKQMKSLLKNEVVTLKLLPEGWPQRFWDNEVFQNTEGVLEAILEACQSSPSPCGRDLRGRGNVKIICHFPLTLTLTLSRKCRGNFRVRKQPHQGRGILWNLISPLLKDA